MIDSEDQPLFDQPVPGEATHPVPPLDVPWIDPVTHARTSDPGTSHEAAAKLSDKQTMMRTLLATYRETNWTAEEASFVAGYSAEDGAWKRVSDLKRAGWIEPTGATRPGSSGRQQQVCRITDKGREALR